MYFYSQAFNAIKNISSRRSKMTSHMRFISTCPILYQPDSGVCLSKPKILRYLLEGTAASSAEGIGDEEKDASEGSNRGNLAGGCYMLICLFPWLLFQCQYISVSTSL